MCTPYCCDIHIDIHIYNIHEYFACDTDYATVKRLIGEQQLPTKEPDSLHDDTGKQCDDLAGDPNKDEGDTTNDQINKQQFDDGTDLEKSETEPLEYEIAPVDCSWRVLDYYSSGEYSFDYNNVRICPIIGTSILKAIYRYIMYSWP